MAFSRGDAKRILEALQSMPEEYFEEVIARLTPSEVAALAVVLDDAEASSSNAGGVELLAHQIPPSFDEGKILGWLMKGGRGAGKTLAAARAMMAHVHGEPCVENVPGGHRMLIVGPSQLDAVGSCYYGPSGLSTLDPTTTLVTSKEGTIIRWNSGAVARVAGAFNPSDVESIRAKGNNCFIWMEELAAWRMLGDGKRPDPEGNRNAVVHLRLGLRLGPNPHFVASTTPKPRKEIKRMLKDVRVKVTTAPTSANPHLPEHVRQELYDRFGGTRLGRQELDAEMLEDVEGALWTSGAIGMHRLTVASAEGANRRYVAVGVDPPGGATECGIVAVSLVYQCPCGDSDGRRPHLLVEHDRSLQAPPPEWAKAATGLWHEIDADGLAGEINFGGDMVESTLAQSDSTVPVTQVRASRGKAIRAEPMATMSEQGRLHLVGDLPELEEEMTTWDAGDPTMPSPNRLDAMVWAGALCLEKAGPRGASHGVIGSAAGTSRRGASSSTSTSRRINRAVSAASPVRR